MRSFRFHKHLTRLSYWLKHWLNIEYVIKNGDHISALTNKNKLQLQMVRSRRPEVFYKKGVLRNFAKFTGKHLCQSLFFNKVAGLRPGALLKKRLWHRCFLVNFVKFLRLLFLTEHPRWLLLDGAAPTWQ